MDSQSHDPFERVQRVVGRRGAGAAGPLPAAGDGAGTAAEPVHPRGREGTRWRLGGLPVGVVAVGVLVAGVVVAGLALGRGGPEGYVVGPGGVATAAVTAGGGLPGAGGSAAPAPGAVAAPGPGPSPGSDPVPPPAASTPTAAPTSSGSPLPVLLVHVDGAVEHPGVVRLLPGDRVSDAVEAAGGVLPEADTRLVNLARPVVDGELVVVPAEGEQVVPVPPGSGDPPGVAGPPSPSGATAPGALVPLNTADAAALQELPGIGPVLAERIVAWRDEVGPFTSVEELTSVTGIGPAVLEQVRDLVTV